MNNALTLLLATVDPQSYGLRTPRFVGFFEKVGESLEKGNSQQTDKPMERKIGSKPRQAPHLNDRVTVGSTGKILKFSGKYKPGLAEMAIEFFLDFFAGRLQELEVLSSLHIDPAEVGHWGDPAQDEEDLRVTDSLFAAGLIRKIDFSQFGTDYASQQYRDSILALRMDFTNRNAADYPAQGLYNLLLATMLAFGVYGSCFLVSQQSALAFYPHDDMGFGVIGLRDDADFTLARTFLNQANELPDYHAVIKM